MILIDYIIHMILVEELCMLYTLNSWDTLRGTVWGSSRTPQGQPGTPYGGALRGAARCCRGFLGATAAMAESHDASAGDGAGCWDPLGTVGPMKLSSLAKFVFVSAHELLLFIWSIIPHTEVIRVMFTSGFRDLILVHFGAMGDTGWSPTISCPMNFSLVIWRFKMHFWLVVTGTWMLFFHSVGNVIIPFYTNSYFLEG